MVPFFVEELLPFSEMVPFLFRNFDSFLKWYYFCWGILTLLWKGTIFVEELWPFSDWNGTIFVEDFWPFCEKVPFLSRNYDPFLTKMVPFLSRIFDLFVKRYHFCWGIFTISEVVPFCWGFDPFLKWYHFLLRNFYPFLKWCHFCSGISTVFWNGTIFVEEFWPFCEKVPFLSRNYDPFLTEMVPFLSRIFDPFVKRYHFCRGIMTLFWLKWYHFCRGFLTFLWKGTIFVEEFLPYLKWYHFVEDLILFWNSTIFVEEFLPFSKIVPFFLTIFDLFLNVSIFVDDFWPFLKWYLFIYNFFYNFCWRILTLFWNGTIFVSMNFDPFLNWGNGSIFVEGV